MYVSDSDYIEWYAERGIPLPSSTYYLDRPINLRHGQLIAIGSTFIVAEGTRLTHFVEAGPNINVDAHIQNCVFEQGAGYAEAGVRIRYDRNHTA